MEGTPSASGEFVPWRVQFLGAFKVTRLGKTAAFRTKKTASLLAYLTFYAGRPVSRDLLVEALWPDALSDKGRQSLRMAVSSIRAELEAPEWDPTRHIVSERETLEASEDGFVTDVKQFQLHVRAAERADDRPTALGELGLALDLYSGEFLPGFSEEWILPQSLELEEAYAQAVCRFVDLTSELGNLQTAVMAGRRAIAICPTREDLHVALMRAHVRSGQASAAIKQFEELERMLDETWGEQPGEEANAVLTSLPKATGGPVVSRADVAAGPVAIAQIPQGVLPERSAFFGRERELEELCGLLGPASDSPRLVTLFGLGGSGKTKLAQRVARDLNEPFDGKAWFVSLVGAEEPAELHEALITTIAKSPPGNADVLDAVAAVIGLGKSLLVVDNLEQIVEPASRAIATLLDACPGLRILATSRVPLGMDGERLIPVTPLPLPNDYKDLAALRASPSVQLLVEAAQSVRPGFAVTPANAQSVLLLCRRLDGIPLAIELAAAKLALLTPAQVIASISRRQDLSTARPEFPERHRSLEAVIQWSLGLLDGDESAAFASLSVCRGGFNAKLATEILGEQAADIVQRLCRCSLVGWTESKDEVRFEMLETVREMASQLLEFNYDLHKKAVERHFDYVKGLCGEFSSLADETHKSGWVGRIVDDSGNVLAALEAGTERKVGAEDAWDMALPLREFIDRRGRPQMWVGPIDELLRATLPELSAVTATKAHMLLAHAFYGLRDIRPAYEHYLKAIDAADRTSDTLLRIECRTEFISSAITIGVLEEAQKALETAVELLPSVDNPKAAAMCYLNLAWLVFDRGDERESEPLFHKAVEHAEMSGDISTLAASLTGCGCAVGNFRYEEGKPLFDRALDLWTEAGMPGMLAHCLYYRSMIDYRHGHLETALANVEKSFMIFVASGVALGQTCLAICGNILSALGRHKDACACWARSESARRRHGMRMIPNVERDFDREFAKTKAAMSPSTLESAFDRARKLSDEALTEMLFDTSPSRTQAVSH